MTHVFSVFCHIFLQFSTIFENGSWDLPQIWWRAILEYLEDFTFYEVGWEKSNYRDIWAQNSQVWANKHKNQLCAQTRGRRDLTLKRKFLCGKEVQNFPLRQLIPEILASVG